MVWGTYIRMRLLLEAAARAADEVDLLLFVAPDFLASADPAGVAASLRKHWGIQVCVHLAGRSMLAHRGWRSTLRGLFDIRYQRYYGDGGGPEQALAVRSALRTDTALVVAHRLDATPAVVEGVAGRVPVAVNFDDVEHVARLRRVAREHSSVDRWLRRIEVSAIRRAELAVLNSIDSALVCSSGERDYLSTLGVTASIDVVNNAVSFPMAVDRLQRSGKTVMFIGSYGYAPNLEAATELMDVVFPMVLEAVPDAKLLIAGARSERLSIDPRRNPAVEVLGFIDDVAEIYGRADVACCAIRAGGGTRIKIIEAAAWGVPTVSTPLGAEGLDLVEGTEILLAESPRALADCCIRLLEAQADARAMGDAARAKIVRDYEHGVVVTRIADSYRSTMARGGHAALAAEAHS